MFSIFFITKRSLHLHTLQKASHKLITNTIEEYNNVVTFCRNNRLAYDMIPITSENTARIGLILNEVKSIS